MFLHLVLLELRLVLSLFGIYFFLNYFTEDGIGLLSLILMVEQIMSHVLADRLLRLIENVENVKILGLKLSFALSFLKLFDPSFKLQLPLKQVHLHLVQIRGP